MHGCYTQEQINDATLLALQEPRMEALWTASTRDEDGHTTSFDRNKLTLVFLKTYGDQIAFAQSAKDDLNAFDKVKTYSMF